MPMVDLTGEENAMIADRAIEAMPLVEAPVPSTIDPADPKRAALMVSNRSGVKRLEVGSLEKLKDDQTRRRLDRCRMPFNCFVDSGASNHIFYDQLVFDAMWEETVQIQTAKNDTKLVSRGSGNVVIGGYNNRKMKLYNVLFIPDLQSNFLSVSKMESSGFSVVFEKGSVSVKSQSGEIVLQGKQVNGLYSLDLFVDVPIKDSEQAKLKTS